MRDLQLKTGYNVPVLAVMRRNLLGATDRLIIVGEMRDLERLLTETNTRAFGRPGAGEGSR